MRINRCKGSEPEKFGKICTFPPILGKIRSDYVFSFKKRTFNLFSAFSRSEYLFPKSATPSSESNGRPLIDFLRDLEILPDFDLVAAGGTHVSQTHVNFSYSLTIVNYF